MKNNIFNKKILSISAILFCFLIFPNNAEAFFSPDKSSTDNVFEVGTLSFSLNQTDILLDIDSTSTSTASFEIEDTGDISSIYEIVAEKVSCADNFYNGIFLNIDKGGIIYENTLSGVNATTTTDGLIDFGISAASNLLANNGDECEIEIHVRAWQSNFTEFDIGRFSQEEIINLKITATENIGGSVVLNEVLPNPEGSDSQGGLQGEWVELYNLSSSPVDLTDWYIKDEAGNTVYITASSTLNGRTTIGVPGSGLEWVVVFMSGAILNNTGDTVYFYDNNDVLFDSYSFGSSVNDADSDSNNTPQGNNENPSGSETSAQEGKSDARIPDGIGDWIDPVPTPGSPNIIDEITEEIEIEAEVEVEVVEVENNLDNLENDESENLKIEDNENATTTPNTINENNTKNLDSDKLDGIENPNTEEDGESSENSQTENNDSGIEDVDTTVEEMENIEDIENSDESETIDEQEEDIETIKNPEDNSEIEEKTEDIESPSVTDLEDENIEEHSGVEEIEIIEEPKEEIEEEAAPNIETPATEVIESEL